MLRFGVIGRNFIVDWFMEALATFPEMSVEAIYSRKQETGEAFAAKYGVPRVYTDLQTFADCPEIDAAYIASPVSCHYEQAACLLRKGKHVLCEKPAASNTAELRSLLQIAAENHVVFLEAMRFVFDDIPALVQQNLRYIEPIRQVRFEFSKYSSRYDRFLAGETLNAFDPMLSNAAVMDLGCYCLHALVNLFGKPKALRSQSVFLENGFEALGSVILNYQTFIAEAAYSKISTQNALSWIVGEKGAILIDSMGGDARSVQLRLRDGSTQGLNYRIKTPNNIICELRAFHEILRNREDLSKRNTDSVLTMEIIDEIRRQSGIHFPADDQYPNILE